MTLREQIASAVRDPKCYVPETFDLQARLEAADRVLEAVAKWADGCDGTIAVLEECPGIAQAGRVQRAFARALRAEKEKPCDTP